MIWVTPRAKKKPEFPNILINILVSDPNITAESILTNATIVIPLEGIVSDVYTHIAWPIATLNVNTKTLVPMICSVFEFI